MRYEQIKDLDEGMFRRATGVKFSTFKLMVDLVTQAEKIKRSKGGRKSKLSIEDRVLMMLMYLREYRTYFHVGQSYGISESGCYKMICFIEDTLIKSAHFALDGKSVLVSNEFDTIVIDTTESPIERPKKNKENIILGRKKDTR